MKIKRMVAMLLAVLLVLPIAPLNAFAHGLSSATWESHFQEGISRGNYRVVILPG
jgi:hypothetical protein